MAAPLNQVYPSSKYLIPTLRAQFYQCATFCSRNKRDASKSKERIDKDGFRILQQVKVPPVDPYLKDGELPPLKFSKFVYYSDRRPPRSTRMPVDQDWTNVWPSAHTYKWSAVPVPVRQGQLKKRSEGVGDGLTPSGYGNLELMKIPNFLHLTPDHVRKHCIALKKFTTPWPKELIIRPKPGMTDISSGIEQSEMNQHSSGIPIKFTRGEQLFRFPVEIITSDYCFAGPSIRDTRARFVTIKFDINALRMFPRSKHKFIKLVGRRYDPKTGIVTMKMGSCPLRSQNYEYLIYQLTALYFESLNKEPWEKLMTEEDMPYTPWGSENSKNVLDKILTNDQELQEKEPNMKVKFLVEGKPNSLKKRLEIRTDAQPVTERVYYYKVASEKVLSGKNKDGNIKQYKEAVLNLLNMKKQNEPEDLNKAEI